jgi:hypothetical protein
MTRDAAPIISRSRANWEKQTRPEDLQTPLRIYRAGSDAAPIGPAHNIPAQDATRPASQLLREARTNTRGSSKGPQTAPERAEDTRQLRPLVYIFRRTRGPFKRRTERRKHHPRTIATEGPESPRKDPQNAPQCYIHGRTQDATQAAQKATQAPFITCMNIYPRRHKRPAKRP